MDCRFFAPNLMIIQGDGGFKGFSSHNGMLPINFSLNFRDSRERSLMPFVCLYRFSSSSAFKRKMNLDYLKKTVGPQLVRELYKIAIHRPERPIEHLAYRLISIHEEAVDQGELEHNKSKTSSNELSVSDAEKTEMKKEGSG
ncbi:hypothetical protein JTE90_008810 [Oedothorax gibbosus]|uniref:Uncharacterized protein n=1 Tax=Oedothorax gibbosus TaxID=931172 RepID=A0AAV6V6G5_9ARAC|nr:hypothetical protein JTE90_008810 [Oedothorax gibbosus]